MSSSAVQPKQDKGSGGSSPDSNVNRRTGIWRRLGIDRFGAIYVLAGIVIIFSIWEPDTFPTLTTLKGVLNQNAVTALIALSLVIPLSTGVFDLSIGNVLAFFSVMLAWLIVDQHVGVWLAVAISLLVCIVIGVFNASVVIGLGIDSFIATLGTGAVLQALNLLISNDQNVTSTHMSNTLTNFASTNIGGVQIAVFVALAVAFALWWVLEHTVTGRRFYATGFNENAARLAGVRTKRLRTWGLLTSAGLAGLAGFMLTSQVGAGTPDSGPNYLLDAFAAAFLGASQIRPGRFNAFGTIIAVLILGTGNSGLVIAGAPAWTLSFYTGAVLLIALATTTLERRSAERG